MFANGRLVATETFSEKLCRGEWVLGVFFSMSPFSNQMENICECVNCINTEKLLSVGAVDVQITEITKQRRRI